MLRSAVTDSNARIFLEKMEDRAQCDASSLLDLLRLGVRKGDSIRLIAKDGQPDLSGILSALHALAS